MDVPGADLLGPLHGLNRFLYVLESTFRFLSFAHHPFFHCTIFLFLSFSTHLSRYTDELSGNFCLISPTGTLSLFHSQVSFFPPSLCTRIIAPVSSVASPIFCTHNFSRFFLFFFFFLRNTSQLNAMISLGLDGHELDTTWIS